MREVCTILGSTDERLILFHHLFEIIIYSHKIALFKSFRSAFILLKEANITKYGYLNIV